MRRRDFIALLGGAATWPLAVRAQQRAMPVVGFLGTASPDLTRGRLRAFHEGLSGLGYVQGRNVVIEYRWAEQATTTIPVVFVVGTDPVQAGLVGSLNRPDANLTGVTSLALQLAPKRLELLHEMLPAATAVAFVVNPASSSAKGASADAHSAAQTHGLALHVLEAGSERDFATVFAKVRELKAGGLVIDPDQLFVNHSEQLAQLALHYAVPTIFMYRDFVAAGGLMSFGGSFANLPVQQATRIETLLNPKTAKALGLDVPPTLIATADEVIE